MKGNDLLQFDKEILISRGTISRLKNKNKLCTLYGKTFFSRNYVVAKLQTNVDEGKVSTLVNAEPPSPYLQHRYNI